MKKKKISLFGLINGLFMIALMVVTAYPFYYVIIASVSNDQALIAYKGIQLLPAGEITTGAYDLAFQNPLVLSGLRNTMLVLLLALPLNLVMTLICGYFMASRNVLLKKPITIFIMITMYFSGGMIPTYLNIRDLGLYNSLAALIIPGCLSVYNAIITRTAIEAIPESLVEAAQIDGAGELRILFSVITPLLKPTLAVLVLYYGVGHWNSWFAASIYIKDNVLMPLQNVLRSILIENTTLMETTTLTEQEEVATHTETIKYALIVVSSLPMVCLYPFLQKYFTKGVMIGAVKG